MNAGVGYERYSYDRTDVNVTNEYSAKLSVDWKPTTWFTARTSGYFADRRYDTYNYNLFVSSIQFPTVPGFAPTTSAGWFYAPAYQQFMFDNRDRTKANIAFDIVAFRGVTISPTFKFQDDYLRPQSGDPGRHQQQPFDQLGRRRRLRRQSGFIVHCFLLLGRLQSIAL